MSSGQVIQLVKTKNANSSIVGRESEKKLLHEQLKFIEEKSATALLLKV